MIIAELRQIAADKPRTGRSDHSQRYTIQQKFSLPAACLVLALIGLALGVSNRKDGKLASFVLGFGVVFAYYVLLYSSRAAALAGRSRRGWRRGSSNTSSAWRASRCCSGARVRRPADPHQHSAFWRRQEKVRRRRPRAAAPAPRRRRVVVVVRIPHLDWPRPGLLDVYVSGQYLRIFSLAFVALLGIFYISTFMDLADKLFGGRRRARMLLRYFYFQTPQFVFYVIPMAALVATLVTIGLMTKNSELIVMRACGISLYRSALPLLLFAVVGSAVLFRLQEQVMAYPNREADAAERVIRGYPPASSGCWTGGGWSADGDIYHYEIFDPRGNEFNQLSCTTWTARVGLADAHLAGAGGARASIRARTANRCGSGWRATGWTREFTKRPSATASAVVNYKPFAGGRRRSSRPPTSRATRPKPRG